LRRRWDGQKLAGELVARAREQGVSLTGPDGLLKQLTKSVLKTALNQELTEHPGHERRVFADEVHAWQEPHDRTRTSLDRHAIT
jgi:transposase-like protein